MKLTDGDLRQLHAEITAQPDRSGCLGEDLFLRAGEGRLDASEKETVASHIAQCSDCAREYRVAVSMRPLLANPRPDRRRLPSFAVAAAAMLLLFVPALIWLALTRQRDAASIARLQKELSARSAAAAAVRTTPAAVPRPASVVTDLVRPNLDVPIVDLDSDVVRGESTRIPKIIVPQTTDVFTTILHLDEPFRGPIELTIDGAASWAGTWTAREPAAMVTLTLHRRQFPAGTYVLRARSGKRTAAFRFRVEYR